MAFKLKLWMSSKFVALRGRKFCNKEGFFSDRQKNPFFFRGTQAGQLAYKIQPAESQRIGNER